MSLRSISDFSDSSVMLDPGQQTLDQYGFDTPKRRTFSEMSDTTSSSMQSTLLASEDRELYIQRTLDDYFRGFSPKSSTAASSGQQVAFVMPVPDFAAFQTSGQGSTLPSNPPVDSRRVPSTPPRQLVLDQGSVVTAYRTPPRPTNPVAQNITPQALKDAESLLKSGVILFTPTKAQVLDDGITALNAVEDTPNREKRRKKACGLMDGIHDILSPSSMGMSPDRRITSVEYHREASKSDTLKAHGLSPLIPKLARAARSCVHSVRSPFAGVPPRIIDVTHIEGEYNKKGKAVGCHFAPVGSGLYGSLKDIVPNTATGVFYARVPNGYGGWKGSTFFPGHISDLKVLLDLILGGKEMTRCGTRTLYKVESDKTLAPFYFVAFNWASASVEVENSCFPVYDFIEVNGADAAEQGLIDDAEQMLTDLISVGYVVQQTSPLQFILPADGINPERLVFDFGPSTGAKTKVFQGVFVVIPTSKFSKIAGPDLEGILAQVR